VSERERDRERERDLRHLGWEEGKEGGRKGGRGNFTFSFRALLLRPRMSAMT